MELTLPAHREELRNGATLEPWAAKRGRMNTKYRKGGKTLCALYAKEKTLGFMD